MLAIESGIAFQARLDVGVGSGVSFGLLFELAQLQPQFSSVIGIRQPGFDLRQASGVALPGGFRCFGLAALFVGGAQLLQQGGQVFQLDGPGFQLLIQRSALVVDSADLAGAFAVAFAQGIAPAAQLGQRLVAMRLGQRLAAEWTGWTLHILQLIKPLVQRPALRLEAIHARDYLRAPRGQLLPGLVGRVALDVERLQRAHLAPQRLQVRGGGSLPRGLQRADSFASDLRFSRQLCSLLGQRLLQPMDLPVEFLFARQVLQSLVLIVARRDQLLIAGFNGIALLDRILVLGDLVIQAGNFGLGSFHVVAAAFNVALGFGAIRARQAQQFRRIGYLLAAPVGFVELRLRGLKRFGQFVHFGLQLRLARGFVINARDIMAGDIDL